MDKKIPLFSLVEPSEMQELLSLLQPVRLEPGQVLFRENTEGDGMWILGEGAEVSISQTRGKRPVVIANNRSGESVGEMALIDGGPRSGAAVVTQGGSAQYVSAANFRALRDAYRPAAFKVMRQLCKELCSRLRATSDRIAPSKRKTEQAPRPPTAGRRATEAEVNAFPAFQALPKVVKLALCQKLQAMQIGANHLICSEGEHGDRAFFLLSGVVRVTRNGKSLQRLRPGAMFGMVSVIDEGRRSATCIAEGPAHLLSLSKRDFDNLFMAGNRFAFQMVDLVSRQLVTQLRSTNQLASALASAARQRQSEGGALPEMLPLELEIELS
jgi:CRP-like cAMP-binding protein